MRPKPKARKPRRRFQVTTAAGDLEHLLDLVKLHAGDVDCSCDVREEAEELLARVAGILNYAEACERDRRPCPLIGDVARFQRAALEARELHRGMIGH